MTVFLKNLVTKRCRRFRGMNIPLGGEKKRKKNAGKNFPTCYPWQRGALIKGPTLRVDSTGSTLSVAVYFFLAHFFSRFVFDFLNHIFPLWLVSLYCYCWHITASRGFCDKRISVAWVAAGPRIVYVNDINILKTISLEWLGRRLEMFTAISRKLVGKNVPSTTPKGNMGYDQYSVPWHCSFQTYFCCFPLALANIHPWRLMPFFQISLTRSELKTTNNTFRDYRVHFWDNLSRNSCK